MLLALLIYAMPMFAFAVGDSLVALDAVKIDTTDQARILRGGQHFQQTCLSCHSLVDFVNDPVAKELGLSKEQMPVWPEDSWNGHPPPDLSLIALSMSPDWLFTYLRTYYVDKARPTGYNNLVYPNTNMPNPFVDMQGHQVLINPNYFDKNHAHGEQFWYRVIKLKETGRLSPAEFDDYVDDIVQFLTYVSDPSVHARRQIGPWVLGYLTLFIMVTYAYFRLVGKDYFQSPKSPPPH
ncbi:MAG TPA: hypothetical protein DCW33_03000 [Proteobacteria bacterium]|nr:hypothetical protein [Pseudomonadota bacterium]